MSDNQSEEEIGIGGYSVPTKASDTSGQQNHHAHLEGIVGPGGSDAELIDALLQLPPERLIPWETCQLPSRGLYYGWQTPIVEVRAMGQVAEKILATQRLAQSGESIDYLFRECVRFPDPAFDPMDLLVGDRIFLLYYLRGITHGNMYEFAITCPNPQCQKSSTHSYDLNNLAGTIKWADPSLGMEPFKVSLPYLSECLKRDFWVGIRLLRGRDTNNMIAMRRTRKKMFAAPAVRAGKQQFHQEDKTIDDTLTENLQMIVVSLLGIQDRGKINRFVSQMHATDTAAIREWLRDNTPGIETMVSISCPDCGQEFNVDLPVSEAFFRSSKTK